MEATAGQTLQMSTLFSATDADNDTLAYVFYDNTAGGGHFEVNGVTQAAGQIFARDGGAAGADDVRARCQRFG